MNRILLHINHSWGLEQLLPDILVHGVFLYAYYVFHDHQPQQQKEESSKQ